MRMLFIFQSISNFIPGSTPNCEGIGLMRDMLSMMVKSYSKDQQEY